MRVETKLGLSVFREAGEHGLERRRAQSEGPAALEAALQDAFRYDTKVLIEKAIAAREIEVAVLENPDPASSSAGERRR